MQKATPTGSSIEPDREIAPGPSDHAYDATLRLTAKLTCATPSAARQVTAILARASERGYTQGMDAPSIGRSLRERNIAAMSPERRLDLWEIEVREFVDLLPDVARREFVRRFRRNHPAPAGEPSTDVDGISDTPSHEAPDANP